MSGKAWRKLKMVIVFAISFSLILQSSMPAFAEPLELTGQTTAQQTAQDEAVATQAKDPEAQALDKALTDGNTYLENVAEEHIPVMELAEKREPNVKHFLNDDSTMTAVVYDYDVHYDKNDIYNLKAKAAEKLAANKEMMANDGKTAADTLEEEREYVEIDNRLALSKTKSGESIYSNQDNPFKVSFAKSILNNELVILNYKGHELSWSMNKTQAKEEVSKTSSALSADDEAADPKTANSQDDSQSSGLKERTSEDFLGNISTSTAQEGTETIETTETTEQVVDRDIEKDAAVTSLATEAKLIEVDAKKSVRYSIMAAEKAESALVYENVQKDVDLQYGLTGRTLKENIVINEKGGTNIFQFTFEAGQLSMKEEDGYILFQDEEGATIYYLYPFYMFDSCEGYSDDIDVTIEELENNSSSMGKQSCRSYLLTIEAAKEWLEAEERVYPVTIDPTISATHSSSNIYDSYVSSASPGTNYNSDATVKVGQNNATKYRSFFRFNLPTFIKGSDRVVDAQFALCPAAADFPTLADNSNGAPIIEAHNVTSTWGSTTINWNNQPSYDAKVVDYETIGPNDTTNSATRWYLWDITKLVDKWYIYDVNEGLMLKYNDESGYGANAAAYFASCQSSITDAKPVVYITYLNTIGLEDYWTYHALDAGLAGTGYINDFTGELTAAFTDYLLDSDRMPFALSHVYSSSRRATSQSTLDVGKGWMLNIQESVTSVTLNGVQKYKYIDGDGTEHYFEKNSSNVWQDDSGLELTLTIGTSTYTITSKEDFVRTFNKSAGYLTKMTDSNDNAVTINYSSGKIASLTTCSGGVITFNKNSSNQLTSINMPDGRTISYEYVDGYLETVNHPGSSVVNGGGSNSVANQAKYVYSGSANAKFLIQMVDVPHSVRFRFEEAASCYRVHRYYDYTNYVVGDGENANLEGQTDVTYGYHTSRHTEAIPGDGSRWEKYIFNALGQTINAQDQDGYAIFYRMGAAGGAKNKITFESKVQKSVINLLDNHNFEKAAGSNGSITNFNSKTANVVLQMGNTSSFIGTQRVRIQNAANADEKLTQQVTVKGGKTYTFSAYMKSYNFAEGGAYLSLEASGQNRIEKKEDLIAGSRHYVRYAVTIDLTDISEDTNVTLEATVGAKGTNASGATGTVFLDALQLEEGECASRYNMLENPELDYPNNGDWEGHYTSTAAGDGWTAAQKRSGTHSYHMKGNPRLNKWIDQTVKVNGKKGEGLVCGVWVKTNGVPNKDKHATGNKQSVGITLELKNSAGTSQYESILFSPTNTDWQYIALEAIAVRDFATATVHLKYTRQYNDVYFDEAQLYKDSFGESFNYDAKGNVISAVDMAKNTENIVHNGNNDLTSYKDGKGGTYTFEYDNGNTSAKNHNLTEVKAPDSSYTRMAYSSTGQPTYTTVYSHGYVENPSNTNKRIASRITYAGTNNHKPSSTTDQRGLVTNYNYSQTTGFLNSVQEPVGALGTTGLRTTNYGYDSPTKLLTAVTNSADAACLNYGYDKGNLTFMKIGTISNYLQYNMLYDAKNNLTDISVQRNTGSPATLVTNGYDDNNRLVESQYANSSTKQYLVYDKQDRVVGSKWGNDLKARFFYNTSGELGKTVAYDEGTDNPVETNYDYDFADRILSVYNSKGFGINNITYDKNNMGTGYTAYVKNDQALLSFDTGYTYNSVDNLTNMTAGATGESSPRQITQSYDTLGRAKTTRVLDTVTANDSIFVGLTYLDIGNASNDSTNLLSKYAVRYSSSSSSGQNADQVHEYTYDRAGNVVTDKFTNKAGTAVTTGYTYDAKDQLTGVTNKNSANYQYTYDTRGNITQQKKLTTGNVQQALGTYTYGITNLDQLTSFNLKSYAANGTTITGEYTRAYTYDAMGNPTKITQTGTDARTTDLTWKEGKLLDTLSMGSAVDNTYYYNENELLTKVVKKDGSYIEYFYTDGSDLECELRYNSSGTLTRVLKYFYNNDGNLQFLLSKSDNFSNSKAYNLYYYVRDALGNITSLLKVKTQNGSIGTTDTKTLVAEYKYDAYGQIISATRPSGVTDDIYQVNPICYKDYYYDADTGWYNLTTRYYDPVVGRFISADDVSLIAESTDEMGDKNLYAYCDNNPISRADKGGEIWNFVIGAAIGAGIEIASQVITSGKITNWKAVGLSAAMGTIGGGAASAVSKVAGTAGSL
jgi:RHS repeat-associated protein